VKPEDRLSVAILDLYYECPATPDGANIFEKRASAVIERVIAEVRCVTLEDAIAVIHANETISIAAEDELTGQLRAMVRNG
jgi:hypothetical protein